MEKTNTILILASVSTIISLICMFVVDKDVIVGLTCLIPAVLYLLSYITGERHERDFLGMTNTLILSAIWLVNALIWLS